MERSAKIANGFSLFRMKKENLSEGSAEQKMKFSSKDFFSKYEQIRRFL